MAKQKLSKEFKNWLVKNYPDKVELITPELPFFLDTFQDEKSAKRSKKKNYIFRKSKDSATCVNDKYHWFFFKDIEQQIDGEPIEKYKVASRIEKETGNIWINCPIITSYIKSKMLNRFLRKYYGSCNSYCSYFSNYGEGNYLTLRIERQNQNERFSCVYERITNIRPVLMKLAKEEGA